MNNKHSNAGPFSYYNLQCLLLHPRGVQFWLGERDLVFMEVVIWIGNGWGKSLQTLCYLVRLKIFQLYLQIYSRNVWDQICKRPCKPTNKTMQKSIYLIKWMRILYDESFVNCVKKHDLHTVLSLSFVSETAQPIQWTGV
jgi:hypothetical protein